RRPLLAAMLDSHFDPSWDIADPFPRKPEWYYVDKDGKEHYRGPRFEDILYPICWATERDRTSTSKKPAHKARDDFIDLWWTVKTAACRVHRSRPDVLGTRDEFNRHVRPYSDVEDTARLMDAAPAAQVQGLCYRPHLPPGAFNDEGKILVNTF